MCSPNGAFRSYLSGVPPDALGVRWGVEGPLGVVVDVWFRDCQLGRLWARRSELQCDLNGTFERRPGDLQLRLLGRVLLPFGVVFGSVHYRTGLAPRRRYH